MPPNTMDPKTPPTIRIIASEKKTEPSSTAATRDTISSELKTRLPRLRGPPVGPRSSARSAREPQAKRPAATPEGPTISAANEEAEAITPPLPLHDQRAVAPKDAGVPRSYEALDKSVETRRALLKDALNRKIYPASAVQLQAIKIQPQQSDSPVADNIATDSGSLVLSGRVSGSVEDLWETEMDDFIAPVRTLDIVGGGDDAWVVVFEGSDEWEKRAKPTRALLSRLWQRPAKFSQAP